jgi:hypothetical protein
MKRIFLFFAVCLLVFTSACGQWNSEKIKGNGKMQTTERNVDSYDAVKLVGSMNVQLTAGKEGNLKVEAESNLHEYIVTEVNGGILKISTKKGFNVHPSKKILITVPFESLEEISLTGSGDIWTADTVKGSELKVHVTGSGDMKLNLEVKDLKGAITGSGDIQLKGKSKNFKCSVTGSGDFEAFEMIAENVEAQVSGSGDIMVNASKSLKATVSGSGDIVYKGNPEKQDFKTHGSGRVSSH